MTLRPTFGLAIVVAALALIPVLVIVGLGVYGSSLGGSANSFAGSGAELRLLPASGFAGAAVAIQGRQWPPRKTVSLYVRRPELNSSIGSLRVRIDQVVASRSGSFQVERIIPASIIGLNTREIFIEAQSGPDTLAGVRYEIVPRSNTVSVIAFDGATRASIEGAIVAVVDGFGRRQPAGLTDGSGQLSISGLSPGTWTIEVRRLDYEPARVREEVSDAGEVSLDVALTPSPGRRLILTAPEELPDGRLLISGIDRSSGLAFSDVVDVPPGRHPPTGRSSGGGFFDYLLATHDSSDRPVGVTDSLDGLWAMGALGSRMASMMLVYPVGISYVGSTDMGHLLHVAQSRYASVEDTRLYLIDTPISSVVFSKSIGPSTLLPLISNDGSRLYVLDWLRRRLSVHDGRTGDEIGFISDLPFFVQGGVSDVDGDALLLLTADRGEVFRLDLGTGELTGPLIAVPGATSMSIARDGRLLIAVPSKRQILVADVDQGLVEQIIQLASRATWIWADPEGPFVFAGRTSIVRAVTVHVLDAGTLKVLDRVAVPRRDRAQTSSQLGPN